MSIEETEKEIAQFWEKNQIFEKSVKNRPKEKQFVFYDGPPFATGLPHYGHILSLTVKDLYPRFWTMQGYRCERRWGWDCHGLPIENIAEKELGIRNKQEIEQMGVTKFNEFCRSKVLSFAKEWKKTVSRMGKWIDFDNSYKTMDNTYLESVWHIFKTIYHKGYAYEGKKILMYCPRCETPLSNSEIAMDDSYKQVTEKTATVKFKLKNDDAYVLAWTTTPWTLIGNVALAVNEELTYARVKHGDEELILAKDRLEQLDEHTIIETFKGKELLNKEYETLYEHETESRGHYIINGGSEVSAEEGTGIVHMALYGEFDYEMIKKYKLPVIQHVGTGGKIEKGPEKFKGMWFKKADEHVLNDLDERSLLLSAEPYVHRYPFCYRCDTPLFYNAVDSWFIDIQKIKPKLLERNKDINWYPQHIKDGRFKHILETAPDWSISRNRFWATAIPVWKCEACKKNTIIGSIAELQEKAIEKVENNIDLHKHVIDNIHLKCDCGEKMNRIPDVFDCWFESGSMPYASCHYPFENKEEFLDQFPGDFISEYIGQVRAWFYYMHVLGVLLFDEAPFKNCVVTGTILASDGAKMSKSKKNYPDPANIFESFGADTLRFYLMQAQLMRAEDLNFNEEKVKEIYRKYIVLASNVTTFYNLFKEGNESFDYQDSQNMMDKWMIHKTNLLIREVTYALENYDTNSACMTLSSFVSDLSTWFVRRSRDRFKSSDEKEKQEAVKTLAFVLKNFSQVTAPITPFIAEKIHQELGAEKESVHLTEWPGFDNERIDEKLDSQMQETREVVTLALKEREVVKIPIRQPLQKITIFGKALDDEFLEIICAELNVKQVICQDAEEVSIKLDTKITPELEAEGFARELVRRVQSMRKKEGLQPDENINMQISSKDELIKRISEHQEYIQEKCGISKLVFSAESHADAEEVVIRGEKFFLSLGRK